LNEGLFVLLKKGS